METEKEKSDKNSEGEEFKETDPLKDDEVKTEVKRSFADTCALVVTNITVEPSMLLFVMSCMITMMSSQNLFLQKACRVNLNYTDEICQSLKTQNVDSQNIYEKEVQKLLAGAMASRTYISATVPCILALFIGSWSDLTGHRKVFIIIPITGQFLLCVNNMLNVYYFDQLRLEVLVYSEAVIEGFSGGWCVIFLACFAYIGSITTNENRTFRIGLINFSLTVGFPIGMGISGVLLRNYGFYGCFGLSATLHCLNALYTFFVLKDPKRSKEEKEHDGRGLWYFLRTFFNLAHMRDTLKVVFKKTPDNRRLRLCILLGTVCILFGPMYGEVAIMYMSTRYRFNWDEVMYSLFQTYNFITHTIGTMFSILVFSKYLQWHDSMLGIISTISKICSSFVYCFAPNEKIFFIAPLVDILNGTALLAIRSIFSKSVAPNELGKVNSVVGLTENLMPLVYVPLYTKVYTSTMEVLPGTVFLMGASMTIPGVFVFIWLFYEHRKGLRKTETEKPVNGMTDVELHQHAS